MKTIVFFHSNLLYRGGSTKVVLEQAFNLTKLGYFCPIITTKKNIEITKNYPGLKIYCLSNFSTGQIIFWLTFPWFFLKLIHQVKKITPDIIYCHSLGIYWGSIYKLIFPKTKVIIYFHDLGFPYFDSKTESDGLNVFFRNIIRFLKPLFNVIHFLIIRSKIYLVANSQTSAKELNSTYHRSPDMIIWPTVDTNIFYPCSAKKNTIVTVGRLEKIKNIETTINGFIDFYHRHQNAKVKLLIVGDGMEKKYLQKISQGFPIKFYNNQPPKKLAKIYSQSIMGIFMSAHESFGLTVIECLACGTPVVGVNCGGVKEIVTNFNKQFLVENNALKLGSSIETLFSISQKESTINNAIKSVKRFSSENQINHFAKWLNSSQF